MKRHFETTILPEEIRLLTGCKEILDSSCNSNAAVFRTDTGYFIKTDESGCLAAENERASLFYRLGLGPEVCGYFTLDRDWLVTREVDGSDFTHFLDDPEKLCQILADALRNLHSLSTEGIPVSGRYRRYMDAADGISEGCYDASVLMEPYRISSKDQAWSMMQKNRNLLQCDTLIHGDACLPNLMQKDGVFQKFIDVGMAGLGDRHIDLYWAIWSLQTNLKTDRYRDLFLDLYGREHYSEEAMQVVAAFEVFG